MGSGESSGPIHPEPTRRSGYLYLFYDKHHGRGGPDASQWLPAPSHDDEFAIFDTADHHQISDDPLWLFGVWVRIGEKLPHLGTRGQKIAAFRPHVRDGEWHGYPLYPMKGLGQTYRPSKLVFHKLLEADLISLQELRRLRKGLQQ